MVKVIGGERLEQALNELSKQVGTGGIVRVGFLEDATYPDGTPVALVAAIQEFGAPSRGIPPRPFFRGMIAAKSREWAPAMAWLLKMNKLNIHLTLEQTGIAVKGQLQEAITKFVGAPLAPSTIARKGHSKQLVDTGHMLNSVDYEVKDSDK